MNTAKLNFSRLNVSSLNSTRLNTSGFGAGKGSGGVTPPEPTEENAWLWGDGTTVLWGDGTTVLIEQNV